MALERTVDADQQEVEADRVESLASGIYGAIVAMGVIDAAAGHGASAGEALETLLVSLAILWLAHSYATALARAVRRQGSPIGRLPGTLAREWPLLESGFLPSLALLVGIAGLFSDDTATNVAVFLAGLNLVGWGVVVGRAQHGGLAKVVVSALFTAACTFVLGLVYVSVH